MLNDPSSFHTKLLASLEELQDPFKCILFKEAYLSKFAHHIQGSTQRLCPSLSSPAACCGPSRMGSQAGVGWEQCHLLFSSAECQGTADTSTGLCPLGRTSTWEGPSVCHLAQNGDKVVWALSPFALLIAMVSLGNIAQMPCSGLFISLMFLEKYLHCFPCIWYCRLSFFLVNKIVFLKILWTFCKNTHSCFTFHLKPPSTAGLLFCCSSKSPSEPEDKTETL